MYINNQLVPPEIESFHFKGKAIKSPNLVKEIFGGGWDDEINIYGPDLIESETKGFVQIYEVQVLGIMHKEYEFMKEEMYYFGKESLDTKPGSMDATEAILIGDLGPDCPIALDYRHNKSTPSVIYLNHLLLWEEIFPSFADFYKKIKYWLDGD